MFNWPPVINVVIDASPISMQFTAWFNVLLQEVSGVLSLHTAGSKHGKSQSSTTMLFGHDESSLFEVSLI